MPSLSCSRDDMMVLDARPCRLQMRQYNLRLFFGVSAVLPQMQIDIDLANQRRGSLFMVHCTDCP